LLESFSSKFLSRAFKIIFELSRKGEADMKMVVEVRKVKKSFGKLQVLDGADFYM